MKIISAKNLRKLGFKRENSAVSGAPVVEAEYHYYTYEVNDKCLLISCSNDEKVNGGYDVEFFDIQGLKFIDLKHLKTLVKLLKAATNE